MLKELVLGISTFGILTACSKAPIPTSFEDDIPLARTQLGETTLEKVSEDRQFYLVGKDLDRDGRTDITVYYLNCGVIDDEYLNLKKPLGLFDSYNKHWTFTKGLFRRGIYEPDYKSCD